MWGSWCGGVQYRVRGGCREWYSVQCGVVECGVQYIVSDGCRWWDSVQCGVVGCGGAV